MKNNKASMMVLGASAGYPASAGSGSRTYPISKYFQNAKNGEKDFNVYEIYDYATYCHPTDFFGYYDAAHNINPWFRYYLRYIVEHLFSGYRFVGPDRKVAEKFWRDNNMRHQIRQLGQQAVKHGSGIAKKLIRVGTTSGDADFAGIQTLYTPFFTAERNEQTWDEEWHYMGTFPDDYRKPGERREGGLTGTWKFGEPFSEEFVIFRPFSRPEQVWGFSPLQSCIHALESLHALTIEDIPAAARNHMAIQRIMKVNLDGIEDAHERETAMKALQKDFSQFNSAKADVLMIHDKHELGYITGIGGGGVGSRLENMTGLP